MPVPINPRGANLTASTLRGVLLTPNTKLLQILLLLLLLLNTSTGLPLTIVEEAAQVHVAGEHQLLVRP